MFVPDPTCPPRIYKEFKTLENVDNYLKLHQSIYRSFVKNKKCSVLAKDTNQIVRTYVFK